MKPWLRQDVLEHTHVTLPRAVGYEGRPWASRILKKGKLKDSQLSTLNRFAEVYMLACLEHQ